MLIERLENINNKLIHNVEFNFRIAECRNIFILKIKYYTYIFDLWFFVWLGQKNSTFTYTQFIFQL